MTRRRRAHAALGALVAACGEGEPPAAGSVDGGAGGLEPIAVVTATAAITVGAGGGGGGGGEAGGGGAGEGCGGEGGATEAPAIPVDLHDTGLSCNPLYRYEPLFGLYADGAAKRRLIWLPPSATIDESDADAWQFPVGTRLWKTFRVGGKAIETRFIWRWGTGPDDVHYATYLWNESQSLAPGNVLRADPIAGAPNALGTEHDVPSETACHVCHDPHPSRILGYQSVQLVPKSLGDAAATAALGYLHANCGHCHADGGTKYPTPLRLRLRASDATVEETLAYQTTVGKKGGPKCQGHALVEPGKPELSCLYTRMANGEMPPIGVETVDARGLAALGTWIASLPSL
jgi:hypothetical protein